MYDVIRLDVAQLYTSSPRNPFSLISALSVQSSSLRHSSHPSPLYFHFHRPPFFVVLLPSHHMPILLQPPFQDFIFDFNTQHIPLNGYLTSRPIVCNKMETFGLEDNSYTHWTECETGHRYVSIWPVSHSDQCIYLHGLNNLV